MKTYRINIFVIGFILLTVVVLSCDNASNVEAPFDKYFFKYYGEDGDQTAVDMIVNADGTIILLGKSLIGNHILLVKVDAQGSIEWQRKLGTDKDTPKDIEPIANGNYVIVSDYQKETDTDIKLIRINSEGFKIDSVIHGTTENDIVKSVTPTLDNGFIIAGSSTFTGNGQPAGYISQLYYPRCDENLVFLDENVWSGHLVLDLFSECIKIIPASNDDNLYYVFGNSNMVDKENSNKKNRIVYYSVKKGADRNPVTIYFGENHNNENEIETQDNETAYVMRSPSTLLNGYFIVSTTNESSISSKLRVSKLRDELDFGEPDKLNINIQFNNNTFPEKRLQGVSASPSLTVPQGFLVVSNETTVTGDVDVLLSKVDLSGRDLWSVNFGSEKNDRAAAVAELPDGKILVLCTIESLLQKKMALLKLNSKGQLLD